jgi:hypothetical protein
MADQDKRVRELHDKIVKKLTDEGHLLEAGFVLFAAMAIPDDAPESQTDDMRLAFMAGAQHLFGSMMGMLDPGAEPSDAELRRMDAIHEELKRYGQKIKDRISAKERGEA